MKLALAVSGHFTAQIGSETTRKTENMKWVGVGLGVVIVALAALYFYGAALKPDVRTIEVEAVRSDGGA